MLTTDPLLLSTGIALLGFVFGIVLYRGDYCMVAMLRDFFLIRDTTLLRSFVFSLKSAPFTCPRGLRPCMTWTMPVPA
jgi:hypothetical protein